MIISELKVMQNDNGIFYLGRTSWDEELKYDAPFSRQSMYFKTKDEALTALEYYPAGRRNCMENADLYYQEDQLADPRASFDMQFDYF